MKDFKFVANILREFWDYKPDQDGTPLISSANLTEQFSVGKSRQKAAISTFSAVVDCPYRVVNIGLGNRPRFDAKKVQRMQEGTKAHQAAEVEINARNKAAGLPTWRTASPSEAADPTQELLEAPEVTVRLSVGDLKLGGRADGLLRAGGLVTAVERKPRTAMYKPASMLQAMSYAIGGCLALGNDNASLGAGWVITSHTGDKGRSGQVSQSVTNMLSQLGDAYLVLLEYGAAGDVAGDLPGPSSGKCARCEYFSSCNFKAKDAGTRRRRSDVEPVWAKFANRRGKAKGD